MRAKDTKNKGINPGRVNSFWTGYELIHHRVTQSFTEFNQFEIKRIELRETLCYSVVKTHYYIVMDYK